MKGSKLTPLFLLPIMLVGCATHDPNQVRIEDRSLQVPADQSVSNQPGYNQPGSSETTASQATAPTTNIPAGTARTYPTEQPAVVLPSVTPGETASAAPRYQPPAAQAAPAQPSGALLALLEQAEQQHQSGRNQQALSSLERAQRIAPRDPLVYLQLARLRLDMKDYPRAQQLAKKGLSLSSGNDQMQKAFKALLQQIAQR
ncbi:MAG: tetratricopeptide repeat protein [Motiliproteus sp.]|nr:tetratricopeptide repeat protein [Motiliproteus sp.]MCW9053098.1 tetratricopeptide repeat protein [Motiliproteus sp.]